MLCQRRQNSEKFTFNYIFNKQQQQNVPCRLKKGFYNNEQVGVEWGVFFFKKGVC